MSEPIELAAYPATPDQWWQIFDAHKDELRALAAQFLPVGAESSPDYKITAPGAEAACEQVRDEIKGNHSLADFDLNLAQRDGRRMGALLNAVWFGLPESASVRSLPGFFTLCDLCEQACLFYPPEEADVEGGPFTPAEILNPDQG